MKARINDAEAVDRQTLVQLVGAEVADEAGHDAEAGQPERSGVQPFAHHRPCQRAG